MLQFHMRSVAMAAVILLAGTVATPIMAFDAYKADQQVKAEANGSTGIGTSGYSPPGPNLPNRFGFGTGSDASDRAREFDMPNRLVEDGKKALADGDTAKACKAFLRAQDIMARQTGKPSNYAAGLIAQYCTANS